MTLLNTNSKGLAYIKSDEQFDHARRKAFIQDTVQRISGHKLDLLSFDEVVTKLRLQDTVSLGLQDVPLDQIVGSCGRYTDFTRTFLPRSAGRDKERWRQIYTLALTGEGFPPIEVYKIDQVYFVNDGNHRVSVARLLNWKIIQAYVTELPTVFTVKPNIHPDELLIKEECALFLERTQLHKFRPDADIVFTEPGRYRRLLAQISVHCFVRMKELGREPVCREVVEDWYDRFYQPMIEHLQESGVMKLFPRRTVDDLAAWLVDHQKSLRLHHDLDEVGYSDDIDHVLVQIDRLTPWAVAKVEVEDKLKGLFKREV